MKKAKRNSLIITIIYFLLSAITFCSGGLPNVGFLKAIENIIGLPALIVFGIGFGGGESAGIFAGVLTFLTIWGIFWLLLTIFDRIIKKTNK